MGGLIKKTQFSLYPLEKISEVLKEIVLESPDQAFSEFEVRGGKTYTADDLKGMRKDQIVLPADSRLYLYTNIDPDTKDITYITTFYARKFVGGGCMGCISIPRRVLMSKYKELRECLK